MSTRSSEFAILVTALTLLTSLSRAEDPGWVADSKSGCKLWNEEPRSGQSVVWSGGCQDGLASGSGVVTWSVNGVPGDKYSGDIDHGKENGHGTKTWADGTIYEGEWRDGKRYGHGAQTWAATGVHFDGAWRNGRPDGLGTETLPN